MFGLYSHSLIKHFRRHSLHMNCRKSVPKLKRQKWDYETQVAAETARNYDIVSHFAYPQQTKKPNSASGLCVVLKGTVTWNLTNFRQENWPPSWAEHKNNHLRWCYTRRFATIILNNVGTMLQPFETMSQQCCNAVLHLTLPLRIVPCNNITFKGAVSWLSSSFC